MRGNALFEPGRNCAAVALTQRHAVVIDAADYFRAARDAMLRAEEQILLICWDFDPRIKLDPDADDGDHPNRLGDFILWLARRRPQLQIHVLMWNIGAVKLLGRGRAVLTSLRWARRRNITFKFDSAHPIGAAHHQKIVVIDDALAFCGGIDMTADRWDTSAHLDDDPRRRRPSGRCYGAWHDATVALDSEAAKALGEIGRDRWRRACGDALPVPSATGDDIWPQWLKPDFRDLPVAISRTRPNHEGEDGLREIERLYLDMIASARRFIYAENQYFASRKIAEAMAARLAEPDPPEIVLINPETADGPLQEEAMGSARARLMEKLEQLDHRRRFRIYTPVTEAGDPIYVHAKIMIVDDVILRVGSSNMNNRSLGLDSECDVTIEAGATNATNRRTIAAIRTRLMAEHLGVEPEAIVRLMTENGDSIIAVIEQVRGKGKTLVPFEPPPLNEIEKKLADNEVLDPESPDEMFEPYAQRGLFRRWSRHMRRPSFTRGRG